MPCADVKQKPTPKLARMHLLRLHSPFGGGRVLRACNTMRQPINPLSYLFPAFFSPPPLSLLKKNKNKQTELDTFEVGNGVTFGMKQYCIEAPIPNWNNSMRSVCLKCKIKPSHSQYNFFIDIFIFYNNDITLWLLCIWLGSNRLLRLPSILCARHAHAHAHGSGYVCYDRLGCERNLHW